MLRDYQKQGVQWILDKPSCALWWEMGLGKTLTVIRALDELFDRGEVAKVLVIGTRRVSAEVWPRELRKWGSSFKAVGLVGNAIERRRALRTDADVYFVGRELVDWLVDEVRQDWPFDMVVIDESSSFKNAGAKRFKALRRIRGRIGRMVQLTGTPAPNSLLELWPQAHLMKPDGSLLARTMTSYRLKYFRPGWNGYGWELLPGAEELIQGQMGELCFRLSADDAGLEIPELVTVDHEFDLSPRVLTAYRRFERDLILELEESGEVVTAVNSGVLVNKLLQMSSGAMYVGTSGKYETIHEEKMDVLAELLEELNGMSALLVYQYQSELDRLCRRFGSKITTLDEPRAIDRWNNGELDLLALHPASGGHGLNLQTGGSQVIWYSPTWSGELYAQLNARLHRSGQLERVIVHRLLARGTVDGDVVEALRAKDGQQGALLDAVRRRNRAGLG